MVSLKLRDESILSFDLDEGIYHVHRPELLPFDIRDAMIDSREKNSIKIALRNYRFLMDFFKLERHQASFCDEKKVS